MLIVTHYQCVQIASTHPNLPFRGQGATQTPYSQAPADAGANEGKSRSFNSGMIINYQCVQIASTHPNPPFRGQGATQTPYNPGTGGRLRQ